MINIPNAEVRSNGSSADEILRVENLHVGKAIEKKNAIRQFVGVVHFLDRFLALLGRQLGVAPTVKEPADAIVS